MSQHDLLIYEGKFTSKFDTLVEQSKVKWKIPGVSVAVIQDQVEISKAYGFCRLPNEPVTVSTLFNCASMTKAFTAAAVSLVVDDDENYPEVKWHTPVQKLLQEDFVMTDERYTESVTIEDLLSHRTGLPDYDDACLGIHAHEPDTPRSVTRKLRYLPPNKPLRSTFQYNNVMYTVAAHLAETLTGQWIGDFTRENLWDKIGMKETFYGHKDLKSRGDMQEMAIGYGWDEEKGDFFEIPSCEQPEASGSGEVISNVLDFAKFLKCMIHHQEPLSQEGHLELVKPRIIVGDEQKPFMSHQLYALGWQVDTYHGETIINHDGCTNGFGCNMMFIPRLKFGMVIFGNNTDAYYLNQRVCWALVDELLEVPLAKSWFTLQEPEEEHSVVTKEDLYPDLPANPLPLSLPLEAYAGRYSHPGWGFMDVKLENDKLAVDCMDRTWRFLVTLEHVSGDDFVALAKDIEIREKRDPQRAHFRLGANGRVEFFGYEVVQDVEDAVCFQRLKEETDGLGRHEPNQKS